ncbi:MAG TPA: carboxypeptidase-like regulatory domain-containing protein, partial [Candidatus Limnocylindrales bacterium]|nr:carboxypeptidase-like regulatory domain-containing protein [Candidatus Limnocylindrales bacterium]
MTLKRIGNQLRLLCALVCLTAWIVAAAPEYQGQVTFGGMPLPGATVTVTQGEKKFVAIVDQQGVFSFPDLAEGTWTIQIQMTGFT